MLRGRVGDWDASRSDPGALSERQRRAQQVLPERRSSVISEALAARASPSSAESIANLTVGANRHRSRVECRPAKVTCSPFSRLLMIVTDSASRSTLVPPGSKENPASSYSDFYIPGAQVELEPRPDRLIQHWRHRLAER
jgi:hypothetical protein